VPEGRLRKRVKMRAADDFDGPIFIQDDSFGELPLDIARRVSHFGNLSLNDVSGLIEAVFADGYLSISDLFYFAGLIECGIVRYVKAFLFPSEKLRGLHRYIEKLDRSCSAHARWQSSSHAARAISSSVACIRLCSFNVQFLDRLPLYF
jgi:hypothetical protein